MVTVGVVIAVTWFEMGDGNLGHRQIVASFYTHNMMHKMHHPLDSVEYYMTEIV